MTKRRRTAATGLDAGLLTEDPEWRRAFRTGWLVLALLMLFCRTGSAESTQETEFLPEVDAYLKLNPYIRVSFLAKDTREGGDPTQASIGPSVDFYLKPLIKLKRITARVIVAVTSHLPIKADLLLTDRNRADLDWSNGTFTWRYRNKPSLQRTFAIGSYHLMPYASAEFYYESQYSKFSTTELYAGTILPVGRHLEFDPYYEHQNNTGKKPNKQVNALGLTLNLYFSREAH
jgi:hypothetical protein